MADVSEDRLTTIRARSGPDDAGVTTQDLLDQAVNLLTDVCNPDATEVEHEAAVEAGADWLQATFLPPEQQ